MSRDWLAANAPLGGLLRLPLRLIPEGTVLPILATDARGKRWVAGSGPHSCWLGWNELGKRRLLTAQVRAGDVVYDIGANVGSYTILASVLVGPAGRVVAFEPVPENIAFLRTHVRMNDLTNVEIVEAAVGEATGSARFQTHRDRLQGRIDPLGRDLVEVVALDDLLREGRMPEPTCLKIDVEGGELSVLAGARNLIQRARPLVFLATHGQSERQECLTFLLAAGYQVTPIGKSEDEWFARPIDSRARIGNHEVLVGGRP